MIDYIVKQLVVNGIINISIVKQMMVILARLCYTHCKGSERDEGMARHKFRHWDEKRTELLGQPELFVQKKRGSAHYLYAWLQEPEVEKCPLCAGKVIKIQDLFSKTYRELIYEEGKPVVVFLEYEFHKYRCLNSECRHIFAKKIHFASRNDNVTYRLENEIARLVMNGASYGQISDLFDGSLTRQAIGQIFNRWVRKKDELRKTQSPPSHIAIVSGLTDKDRYALILNIDDGVRIYDILYGVQSLDIAAAIRRIGAENIKTVLTDCDPTIVETVKDNLPDAAHIIPVHYWFKLVSNDFADFSHERIKWCTVPDKDNLVMKPITSLGLSVGNLERLFRERPSVKTPHKNFNDLRDLINRRDEMWVYAELAEWTTELDPGFKEYLSITIDLLHLHCKEIEAHIYYHEYVPDQMFTQTEAIEHHISKMRTFSSEVLRARTLYSTETDLQNWQGIPIEDVVAALYHMNGGN